MCLLDYVEMMLNVFNVDESEAQGLRLLSGDKSEH